MRPEQQFEQAFWHPKPHSPPSQQSPQQYKLYRKSMPMEWKSLDAWAVTLPASRPG